jgi:hypothetical protein
MLFLSPRWPIFALFAKVGLFPSAGSTHKPILMDAGKRISFAHYG